MNSTEAYKAQHRTPDDTHHLQYATVNIEFYIVTTAEFLNFIFL
jgi:hypothetical protein